MTAIAAQVSIVAYPLDLEQLTTTELDRGLTRHGLLHADQCNGMMKPPAVWHSSRVHKYDMRRINFPSVHAVFTTTLQHVLPGLLALICASSYAAPATPSVDKDTLSQASSDVSDEQQMQALLALLQNETEIATQSRMNADYVPGIVTVLHGEQLEAEGIHTVWQALGLVPGILVTRNTLGEPLVLIRGTGFTVNAAHIKTMLNSVAMNRTDFGSDAAVLMIPIEQVDRIEVIRGPGSVLYGEYAYAGVVNVITRSAKNRIYLNSGDFNSLGAGAIGHWTDKSRNWKLNLNLAETNTDGPRPNSGQDGLYAIGKGSISYAPREVDTNERQQTAVLRLDHRNTTLLLQAANRFSSKTFGLTYLPPAEGGEPNWERNQLVQLSHRWTLSNSLTAEGQLARMENSSRFAQMVFPYGYYNNNYPGDINIALNYTEQRTDADLKIYWDAPWKHQFLLNLSYAEVEVTDSSQDLNFDFRTSTNRALPGMQNFSGADSFIPVGTKRSRFGIALQDQFQLLPDVELTAGVRYDRYSDVENSLTPRIAAVWRADRHHIFKAQYAKAFRPLTFSERYFSIAGLAVGTKDITPETITTSEIGYIYRRPQHLFRVTAFHSRLNDLIAISPWYGQYDNIPAVSLDGAELELEVSLMRRLKATANVSYARTRDHATDQPLAGAREWLSNITLNWKMRRNWWLVGRWNGLSSASREPNDPRPAMGAYSTIDLTLTSMGLADGLTVRLGANNILNTQVNAPALAGSYPHDLPQGGRYWWLSFTKDL